jgi:O-acetylhomoserine/O-acetylserine sulfhydrylase-like pyridoxal-dependent enzyme
LAEFSRGSSSSSSLPAFTLALVASAPAPTPTLLLAAPGAPSLQPLVLVDSTCLFASYSSIFLASTDLVLHSLAQHINEYSGIVMGAVVVLPHRAAALARLRFPHNAIGAVRSAHDCWLAQRWLRALYLRMRAHGANALTVTYSLAIYPGPPSHARHAVARRSLASHTPQSIKRHLNFAVAWQLISLCRGCPVPTRAG